MEAVQEEFEGRPQLLRAFGAVAFDAPPQVLRKLLASLLKGLLVVAVSFFEELHFPFEALQDSHLEQVHLSPQVCEHPLDGLDGAW